MQIVTVPTRVGPIHFRAGALTGERPLVVILHAFDELLSLLDPFVNRLTDCDLIFGLLPGHNGAPVIESPAVHRIAMGFSEALVATLSGRRYTLIGHSLGGLLAMGVAASNPSGLEAVVAVEPFLDAEQPTLRKVREMMNTSFSRTVLQGQYYDLVQTMTVPFTVLAGDQLPGMPGSQGTPSLLSLADRALLAQHAKLVTISGGHDILRTNTATCAEAIRSALRLSVLADTSNV